MAGFQIFIPQSAQGQQSPVAKLANVGLSHLATNFDCIDDQGPGGEFGTFFAWRKPGEVQMGYQPDSQEWVPAAAFGDMAAGRYHVGFWKDSMPKPKDLQRPFPHPGRHAELGDGNQWCFPVISKLPRDFVLNPDGHWGLQLQEQYADFELECARWIDLLSGNENTMVDYLEVRDFLEKSLSLNYRITPEVVSHLRLFNTATFQIPWRHVLGITDTAETLNGSGVGT